MPDAITIAGATGSASRAARASAVSRSTHSVRISSIASLPPARLRRGGDADVDVGAQALAHDRARRGERVGRREEGGAHAAAVARAHLDQRAALVAVKERAQVALHVLGLARLRRRGAPCRCGGCGGSSPLVSRGSRSARRPALVGRAAGGRLIAAAAPALALAGRLVGRRARSRRAALDGDDAVGGDVDRLALVAVVGASHSRQRRRPATTTLSPWPTFGDPLAEAAPDRDVEVLRAVGPLAGGVLEALVVSDPQAADRRCRLRSSRSSGSRVRFPEIVSWLMSNPLMACLPPGGC